MNQALPYAKPAAIIAHWPEDLPLLHLGGTDRYGYFALAFDEVNPGTTIPLRSSHHGETYRSGYLGIKSYNNQAPDRLFRVHTYLILDHLKQQCWVSNDWPTTAQYVLEMPQLEKILQLPLKEHDFPQWQLSDKTTDETYLEMVRHALEDIRSGRFYQINLLRYYELAHSPSRAELGKRLEQQGEPFAAFLDLPNLTIASFSPERFLRLSSQGDGLAAQTWPIKGTAARHRDSEIDRQAATDLVASAKDQAELHMIVDLMRNDLSRICQSGSVEVEDPGSLHSFANVHHLIACVTGRLRDRLELADLWQNMAPAGSITGAPKTEVIKAIDEYEDLKRRYFMGHVYVWDDQGFFDSSILIRTLVREGVNPYAFAAGSGIVIHSNPEMEMAEVAAKCRAVTADW